jgi:hypothetical protein
VDRQAEFSLDGGKDEGFEIGRLPSGLRHQSGHTSSGSALRLWILSRPKGQQDRKIVEAVPGPMPMPMPMPLVDHLGLGIILSIHANSFSTPLAFI